MYFTNKRRAQLESTKRRLRQKLFEYPEAKQEKVSTTIGSIKEHLSDEYNADYQASTQGRMNVYWM